MGTISFLLPPKLSAQALRDLERACMAGGPDNMPWPTEARVEAGKLVLRRAVDESGFLLVPWEIPGAGRLMASSATLMERAQPYVLELELARGKVNQVRNQAADWQAGGLQVPPSLEQLIRDASSAFGRSLSDGTNGGGDQARAALELAYRAGEELARVYVEAMFQVRHLRQPKLDTAFGCRLGSVLDADSAAALRLAFNSVCLPLAWSDVEPTEAGTYRWEAQDALVEWAVGQGWAVSAGPLLDFSSARLPGWLWLYERDLASLANFACGYVQAAVGRYRDRIRRWQLTAASNCATVLSLDEDELLWLTVRLVEAARQVDPALELVIGIAQPWGEYLTAEDRIHSPFIFADTLIRAGLNLAALDVELVMGVTPRGSYCRDLLEASRMLDLYALLGVPLRVTLGYPSSAGPDADADPDYRAAAGHWHGPMAPDLQADWASTFAALALCKPSVQGVHWSHLRDAEPHQFPHAGLLDAADRPKPALDRLGELRAKHLH